MKVENSDDIYFVHLVSGMTFIGKRGDTFETGDVFYTNWYYPVGIQMGRNGECCFRPTFPFATEEKDQPFTISEQSISVIANVLPEVLDAYKREYSGLTLPPTPQLVLTT